MIPERFRKGHYAGNKWGGKFLRAPEIFYIILKKGKGKLVRLGDIAEVKAGIITGNNQKYYKNRVKNFDKNKYSLVFKSPREISKIFISKHDARSIIQIKNVPFKIRKARLLWVDLRGNKHLCHYNADFLPFEHTFYGLNSKGKFEDRFICCILNSSLTWFFIEVLGRRGLGGGAIRLVRSDLLRFPVFIITSPEKRTKLLEIFRLFSQREIHSIFEELGFDPSKPIREQEPNPLPDRAELDNIIFDELGLTEKGRKEVYWAVAELVKQRLEKARSLKKK